MNNQARQCVGYLLFVVLDGHMSRSCRKISDTDPRLGQAVGYYTNVIHGMTLAAVSLGRDIGTVSQMDILLLRCPFMEIFTFLVTLLIKRDYGIPCRILP